MYSFIGKITLFCGAVFCSMPILSIVLFTGLGHVADIIIMHYMKKFNRDISYQNSSDSLVFFVSTYIFYLNLDIEKSIQIVKNETIMDPDQLDSLDKMLRYYITKKIPTEYKKKNKRFIDDRLNLINKMACPDYESKVRMINLLEALLYSTVSYPSARQIELLTSFVSTLQINYQPGHVYNGGSASYKSTYQKQDNYEEYDTQDSFSSDYKDNNFRQEPKPEPKKPEISEEVKTAFKALGLKASKDANLFDVKKAYKDQVKKYHPDILKGRNATAAEIAKAEITLAELNKSIDIVKKFLANV